MIEMIVVLALLTFLFWLEYHITGALLSAAIWLFIKLPLAIVMSCIGLVCCIMILLIPIGSKCFKFAGSILFG